MREVKTEFPVIALAREGKKRNGRVPQVLEVYEGMVLGIHSRW